MRNNNWIVPASFLTATLGAATASSALAQANSGVLVTVASGINQPIGVIPEPGNDSRLFVIGKTGQILVLNVSRDGRAETYSTAPTPALDITSRVFSPGNRGLLGLAFPPDYQQSGKAYVFYTTQETGIDTGVICRYTRDPANPARFLPESRELIFTAPIGVYHHGGCLRFGPDGYLYFAKGDEGNMGLLAARNPGVYFGKMLRLDVTNGRDDFPLDPFRNYGIPATNPYAAQPGALPEVWAVGLRSPWQFSFDRQTGALWMGDVGESTWEEITCIPAGRAGVDYGWPSFEGNVAGPFGTLGADPARISFPAYVYPHEPRPGYSDAEVGCSVNGGFVYRGTQIPSWSGRFFWSDFCSNHVFSGVRSTEDYLMTDVTVMTDGLHQPINGVTPPPLSNPVAFGEDNSGELFICEFGGRIRKMVPRFAAADIGRAGGSEGQDGTLDNNDFIVFIDWFFSTDARCDMGKVGGAPGGDGVLDSNDFIVFIDLFFNGQDSDAP
ncbi:MAG TPA: PQQ-dependent sugar dehydrogenase [Phycisphaerales bacterium]|nr:PQQ-dependent sugar dehydrogenase [Phycisphaerales bacterium]